MKLHTPAAITAIHNAAADKLLEINPTATKKAKTAIATLKSKIDLIKGHNLTRTNLFRKNGIQQ